MAQAQEKENRSTKRLPRGGHLKGARAVTKGRISTKTRNAMRLFMVEGVAPPDACKQAGCTISSFYAALHKPEGQKYMAELTDQLTQEFEALKPAARLKALYAAMTAIDEGEAKSGMLRAVEFCAGIDKKVGPQVQVNTQVNVSSTYAYPERGQVVQLVDGEKPKDVTT